MDSIYGVLPSLKDAEHAVQQLQKVIDQKFISIVVKRAIIRLYTARYDNWWQRSHGRGAIRAASLPGLLGLTVGRGGILVPEIGSTVIAGSLANDLAATDYNLNHALQKRGIPPDNQRACIEQIKQGSILIIVDGDAVSEKKTAEKIEEALA